MSAGECDERARDTTGKVDQAQLDGKVGWVTHRAGRVCTNTTVKDNPDRTRGGELWVTKGTDGTTTVQVAMTVTPNTTYHFHLKCVRRLGDITTGDEGIGMASFTFRTPSGPFAFDMYPEGAPSGNKFQSLTVEFP